MSMKEDFQEGPLVFYLNGKRIEVKHPQPEQTLISFLRSNDIRLTGTKLGCGEGGCGACTVMISHYDPELGRPVHRAINSCLALLGSVEGAHVTTVEGIGNTRDGLHPVQEKISTMHGSQCGFCTPGIIMALYAFLRENPNATAHEIEESLDGNLCRCTGYRPILDAAKIFASDKNVIAKGEAEEVQSKEKIAGELPPGARICPSSGKPCYCQVESSTETVLASAEPPTPKEYIFPPALTKYELKPICFKGEKSTWYRPLTLDGLLEIKHLHPEARVVMGSSELTIEARFKNAKFPVLISPVAVPELSAIECKEKEIIVGSAVTLTKLRDYLREQIKKQPTSRTKTIQAVLDQLRWFAGNQIRNGASVGGNIATASPISDLNPVWMAAGTNFTLSSYCPDTKSIVTREVSAKHFFISYRKTEMKPNEIIKSINIPFNDDLEYVKAYKQARRREDDIAIVTCAFRVNFSKENENYKVTEASLAYGGMAPITVSAKSTEEYLVGRIWNKETFDGSLAHLEKDLPLAPNAPGGMIQFRRSLTTSFFFKFFCQVAAAIGTNFISDKEKSLLEPFERPLSRGQQTYYVDNEMLPVTAPLMHHSGKKQVTGEAIYIDDIKNPSSGLYSSFVLSTRAHARIIAINPEKALQIPGVKGFFSAKDIPADNDIGPVVHDEELFASKEVLFHGQPVGIIVAETHQLAVEASRAVEVVYDDLPAILSIKDAITADSFFNEKPQIWREDVEEALSKCEHVVSGEMDVGGQEHFYLEPQTTFAEPVEGDELVIYSSTQNPTKTQVIVSRILGIPQHFITVKTKRMGGGFGGKETRSIYVSAAAALAAYHMKQPVRLVLDRDVDMATSGARHPFYCKYKVGFSSNGLIQALDAQIFSLGGYSMDLSGSVLHRAMFHIDNSYFIPALRVTGRICKTNTPTNTAFRGFGGPQGMMFAENYIDHVAKFLKVPASKIREQNYYSEGQLTHYGQPLTGVHLQRLQKEILETSEWDKRKQAIETFNENNRWKKRGIAYVPVKFGMSFTAKFMNQAGALVHVYTDGSVLVSHGGTEMGQGLHIKMIQVAAHALGTTVNKVYVSETSTDKVPNSSPTAASASSDMYGMAVLDACNQIKKKLEELKERLGDKLTDHSFDNLVRTAYFERIPLSATGFYATPNLDNYTFDGRPGTPFAYYTYGIAVSEVEIDVLNGDFQILRADILMDIGNSLNPTIDIGQVEGAFVQGTGWCTIEEIVLLDNGVTFTRGPGTYKIPSFNDIPIDFRVSLLRDAPNPRAIHSSKGIGEPPLFLAASVFWAIKEAVYAARKETTGNADYFEFSSPATCERIRLGCVDTFTKQFAPK